MYRNLNFKLIWVVYIYFVMLFYWLWLHFICALFYLIVSQESLKRVLIDRLIFEVEWESHYRKLRTIPKIIDEIF